MRKPSDVRVREQVRAVIEAVEAATALSEVPHLKKMSGSSGFYRVRVGDYRIGLAVDGDGVEFVRVPHRRDVYRFFP